MSLRGYITNNFWLKFFSLLLAVFTWMTIQASFQQHQTMLDAPIDTISKRTFSSIPVTIMTPSYGTNHYRVDPPVVEVEVTGSEDALTKLNPKDVHVFVDTTSSGDAKLFRRSLQSQVPQGLSVTSLSQNQVNVERLNSQSK